jgi:TolB-like protein
LPSDETFPGMLAMHRPALVSVLALLLLGAPQLAGAATKPTIAVFPVQDLSRGGNDVNLPFTRYLSQRLAESGNEVTGTQAVISFMAANRIRSAGSLETFHVSRVREDLGVSFVLLGTVTQAKERPNPSLGVALTLVRTHDARAVWSYVGHVSAADDRKLLGLGEPASVAELEPLIGNELVAQWPWELISQAQQGGSLSIDSVALQPTRVRPGGEVHARVRLRNKLIGSRAPRAFFQADDQLHAAVVSPEGDAYEATWVAGERDGRYPVTLVLEWPLYARSESVLLGGYLVDGAQPVLALDVKGARLEGDTAVFGREVVVMPRLLIPKPLAKWNLRILDETGFATVFMEERGNLPQGFLWSGKGSSGEGQQDGVYQVVLEVWDHAGNTARAARLVSLNRAPPALALKPGVEGAERVVDLEHDGKVPLAAWRLELWSEEGRLLSTAEGQELPARLGLDAPERDGAAGEGKVRGIVVVRDVLGNRTRREVEDLFGAVKAPPKPDPKGKERAKASQKWVDEF